MRASDILGSTVYAGDGRPIGTISELICRPDADGIPRLVEVQVSPGRRHRLLGYERPGIQGPWLLEKLASWLHRGSHVIPWAEVRLQPTANP